jgi:hypothetical protein
MRMPRSLVCAGLAMIAVSLCASMPAIAAVPLDAHAVIQPMASADYPAPAASAVRHDQAVLPSEMPAIASATAARSSVAVSSHRFASTPASVDAYLHIDPDIAG